MLDTKERFDFADLFTFEMANNHQGDVAHGKKIIKAIGDIARRHHLKAAIKFQFRDLDTFIHPSHKKKSDNKHVPRFQSTRLSDREFKELIAAAHTEGLIVMATPFDEKSVDTADKLDIDILKVASCSATDFPLLEKIAAAGKPVIASTGGLSLKEIDQLVTFLDHRYVHFAVMHCVAIYPTPTEKLQLGIITRLTKRYPNLTIGFSTHEAPENIENIQLAYMAGARIFEKHVGVATAKIKLNTYSSTPEQTEAWVSAWERARAAFGNPAEKALDPDERRDLDTLSRGVFAKKPLRKGQKLKSSDVYFAFPIQDEQLASGKFLEDLVVDKAYKKDEAIAAAICSNVFSPKAVIYQAIHAVKGMLHEAGIPITPEFEVELSHHYGLENFHTHGVVIIDCINREYCKKILVQLPNQSHPYHHHKKKEEAFHILSGVLEIELDGRHKTLRTGEVAVVQRGVKHRFWTEGGAIFEEVSTTHFNDDSLYEDPKIARMPREHRKTKLVNWGRHQFD
ncbi:MAG: N-acetylneuraminate synthase family protein [Minisyncoccia bacterium]